MSRVNCKCYLKSVEKGDQIGIFMSLYSDHSKLDKVIKCYNRKKGFIGKRGSELE